MRLYISRTVALGLLFQAHLMFGQSIWTGEKITFTKVPGASWTQEENQDRITDNVWITRADNQGIFNIAVEASYQNNESPGNTEWAYGSTEDLGSLVFENWQTTVNNSPPNMVGQAMVMHIIDEDIYIDLEFLSWSAGGASEGGGFSYQRSTDQNLSITEVNKRASLRLLKNPVTDTLELIGIKDTIDYAIYDLAGHLIKEGAVKKNAVISVSALAGGVYLLKLNSGQALAFVKQ